jgi:hypothetical protein
MDTQITTIMTTEIMACSGTAFAEAEFNGDTFARARLTIDTGGRGTNTLFIRDLKQFREVVTAVQELQKAVTERLG